MTATYPVVDVTRWELSEEETLGTKRKRWVREPAALGGRRWLLKYRQDETTGDEWAERIACECAATLLASSDSDG